MTLRVLYKLIRKIQKSHGDSALKHGKLTVKQLAKHNRGMNSIEITDDNIKGFERHAKKYGVDFALKKSDSKVPPTWVVFFKAQDTDAINAAFADFTRSMMKRVRDKPSVIVELGKFKEMVKNAVLNPVKNKERSNLER